MLIVSGSYQNYQFGVVINLLADPRGGDCNGGDSESVHCYKDYLK
jgi:hypothetical protein